MKSLDYLNLGSARISRAHLMAPVNLDVSVGRDGLITAGLRVSRLTDTFL